MKKWVVSYIIALAVQLSLCPGKEAIHGFRAVDPIVLEKKVPTGYGNFSISFTLGAMATPKFSLGLRGEMKAIDQIEHEHKDDLVAAPRFAILLESASTSEEKATY